MVKLLLCLLGVVVLLSGARGKGVKVESSANALSSSSSPNDVVDTNWVDDDIELIDGYVDDTTEEIDDDRLLDTELKDEEKSGQHVHFPLTAMDKGDTVLYMDLEDKIMLAQADEHVAFKLLKDKQALYTKGGNTLRRKRIAPLVARAAFAVGRSLFRRFARTGITRSGSRVTRHYNGQGTYNTAVRDFNRMRPDNVRTFNGRISGRTGTVGNHRVTVRDGSSGNSRPTLEMRSHGGDVVRKFRYNP